MPAEIIRVDVKQIVERVDTALVKAIDLNKSGLLKQMNGQFVQKQSDSDAANVLLIKCNSGIKAIDGLRLDMTKPLRDETDRINAEFATVLSPMKAAKDELSDRVMKWRAEEQRKHEEEVRKAQAEEQRRINISKTKGGTGENVRPVEIPQDTLAVRDTTKTRTEYRVVVIDIAKIPPKYFDNEEVINAIRKQLQREFDAAKSKVGKLFNPDSFTVPGAIVEKKEIPIY